MTRSPKFALGLNATSVSAVQVLKVTADKASPFRPILADVAAKFPLLKRCAILDRTWAERRFDGRTGRPAYTVFVKLQNPVPYETAFAMAHEFYELGVAWCFHADDMLRFFRKALVVHRLSACGGNWDE